MAKPRNPARWTGRLIVLNDNSPITARQITPTLPTGVMPMSIGGHSPARWSLTAENPWDAAHNAVMAGSATYAEPDCIQQRNSSAQTGKPFPRGMQSEMFLLGSTTDAPDEPMLWGPEKGADDTFSPVWYLERAGFAQLHSQGVTGAGVRIAHLDTGCYPSHQSTPRNLRKEEGRNFYGSDPADIVDTNKELFDPGHGTATIALLAGNKMDLDPKPKWGYGGTSSGDIGGAPDAEVIPVVIGGIGGSVIHLGDSSMANGLIYALGGNGRKPCDVVTLSHGGYPLKSWADAVNKLYEAGIIVVAAAGDWYRELLIEVPPHYTVYPSAFWRVITATGVTYKGTAYTTPENNTMQGSYGPDIILDKSIAAFTPNVPWMKPGEGNPWDMSGGGTSAATPQIAAACALWVQKHGAKFPADWQRVEACRYALIHSATHLPTDIQKATSPHGSLNVTGMLDDKWVSEALLNIQDGNITKRAPDQVCWPLIRDLIGNAPPGNPEMYEVEAVQTVFRSAEPDFVALAYKDWQSTSSGNMSSSLTNAEKEQIRQHLLDNDISITLRNALGA